MAINKREQFCQNRFMNIALIVAAGTGSRMAGADKPKQFLSVNNKPLMVYTIEAFEMHKDINQIVVVTNDGYVEQVKDWCKQYGLNKVKAVVLGGDTRQGSVFNGLQAIKEIGVKDDDIVLIHDAARPLVSKEIISKNIEACIEFDAVDTVIKANDTIVSSKSGETINDIPNRSELYQSQTPQAFKFGLIYEAHENAKAGKIPNVTDDAKLVISMGKDVHLVEGNKQNFKVTTPDDLVMLEALLKIIQI